MKWQKKSNAEKFWANTLEFRQQIRQRTCKTLEQERQVLYIDKTLRLWSYQVYCHTLIQSNIYDKCFEIIRLIYLKRAFKLRWDENLH